ncbi:MAG: DUF4124 domain-containing protein [Proteobacteria bacterium]|nr:DUF4124 domain-containing protein [Pseudomonadota bacterium]
MRTVTAVLAAALALACGLAQAQAYRWVDKDGKVRYGDFPPAGIKATPLKAPAGGAAPAPAPAPAAGKDGAPAKDAKKGPLTPAEQEQAYRERQLKAKEAKEKADKEQAEAEQNKQACASAQEGLRGYERGGRISSINAQGETVFLDDDQRAARMEQMRKVISETCK